MKPLKEPQILTIIFGALVVLLLFIGWMLWHMRMGILGVLLNTAILYFLLYRAYFDLKKPGHRWYFLGSLLGIVIALLLPPEQILWPVTLIVLVTFVVVELARLATSKKRR